MGLCSVFPFCVLEVALEGGGLHRKGGGTGENACCRARLRRCVASCGRYRASCIVVEAVRTTVSARSPLGSGGRSRDRERAAASRRATVSGTRASRASRSRIFCGDDHDSALGARVGERCPRARASRAQGRRRGPRGARARGLRRGHGASTLACLLSRIGKEGRRHETHLRKEGRSPEMHLRRKGRICGRFHAYRKRRPFPVGPIKKQRIRV